MNITGLRQAIHSAALPPTSVITILRLAVIGALLLVD